MNPLCAIFGHWRRPFVVDEPTYTTVGSTCRVCGRFFDLVTTHKSDALARFERDTTFERDYLSQSAPSWPWDWRP